MVDKLMRKLDLERKGNYFNWLKMVRNILLNRKMGSNQLPGKYNNMKIKIFIMRIILKVYNYFQLRWTSFHSETLDSMLQIIYWFCCIFMSIRRLHKYFTLQFREKIKITIEFMIILYLHINHYLHSFINLQQKNSC